MTSHAHDQNAPPATPVGFPEHFSSEEDATHLYRPKGMQYTTSMAQTRFQIPAEICGPVRSLALVVLTASAIHTNRQRCLAQLRKLSAAGDEMATEVLKGIDAMNLDLDEHINQPQN